MTRLIILVGVPGSGKTTYAKNLLSKTSNMVHISSDAIRKELYGDEAVQKNPKKVFSVMQTRTIELLNNGTSVVYDATNLTKEDRGSIIGKLPNSIIIEAHIMTTPIDVCIKRDNNRERTVGAAVVNKCSKKYIPPTIDEGFSLIKQIKN